MREKNHMIFFEKHAYEMKMPDAFPEKKISSGPGPDHVLFS
jgi:hypothetical protein